MALSTVLLLFNPASALAEDAAVTNKQALIAAPDKSASTEDVSTDQAIPGKCEGGMMRGGGQHGKGGHGGGQHGKGGHDKHRQVVQRLDMIEARMAKIEAMLEILMRR